jgi:hypothetical protein
VTRGAVAVYEWDDGLRGAGAATLVRVRGVDVPIGLAFITIVLFLLAGINVLTKTTATISGSIFTVVFFIAFSLSERHYKPKDQPEKKEEGKGDFRKHEESETELFRLEVRENLSPKTLGVRPGNILVAVHDPNNLAHLEKVLDENDPSLTDVVVLSVNSDCPDAASEDPTHPDEVIDLCETKVFSKVVYIAEKFGKPVHLLAVPGASVYQLILLAASRLRSSRVTISLSEKGSAETQEREIVVAWEGLARPRPKLCVEIVPDGEEASWKVELGRHLVLPSGVDCDIAHRIWLELFHKYESYTALHESDVFGIAIRRLDNELRSGKAEALEAIRREIEIRASLPDDDPEPIS